MPKRNSPIIHRVKSYVRNGKTVRPYTRGIRKHRPNLHLANPNLRKPQGYAVTLRYSDKPRDLEKIDVIATDFKRAIDEAFEEKKDVRLPVEIVVVDPSIGEVLHWVGSHALKYGREAASKAYNATKDKVKSSVSDWETKRLIEQAYSPKRGVRILARSKLRRDHPDVWKMMDVSRS